MPRRGGDWSGRPGHRCEVCNRSSKNVGPRRGFDYANDVCGGCCEISSDDDGHNYHQHGTHIVDNILHNSNSNYQGY